MPNHKWPLYDTGVNFVPKKCTFFCVINSSITTRKLFVAQRFDFHWKSLSGEWKQSFLLPVLGTVSKSCAKKVVVRVAELVAAFFAVHGLLSLLVDVNCLLDPSGGSVRFPVDHRRIRPAEYNKSALTDHALQEKYVINWSARALTSGKSSLGFELHFSSMFLQPDTKFSSCFTYVCLITIAAWNFVDTFWRLLFVFFIFWMCQNASESLAWFHGTWYTIFPHDPSDRFRCSLYVGNHY